VLPVLPKKEVKILNWNLLNAYFASICENFSVIKVHIYRAFSVPIAMIGNQE
jgi:hypothetical protein